MIFQVDKEFPWQVRSWGCYLLSFCERICTYFDLSFTHEYVLDVLNHGQENHLIDEEITLLNPQALCDYIIGRKRILFKGKLPPEYTCINDEFEIVCYHKDGASFNHFCSGNGKGIVIYDPWSRDGSDSVRNGKLIGKRVFVLL